MKQIIMNIGYYDELMLRDRIMTEEDIAELMGLCADNGCTRVQLRVGGPVGRYLYPTKLPNRMVFDRDEAMRSTEFPGVSDIPSERRKQADRWQWQLDTIQETMARFDPLAVARDAAKARGLEFYVWFDIHDDFYPGHLSDFMLNHPECQWTSRDGLHRYNYLRSHAFPEAREDLLGYVREIAEYKPDGFYLCTCNHAQHGPHPGKIDFYGFEAPVAERYLELYDVDIRETADIDMEAWHRVKGEFMTELFRGIKQAIEPVGAKLSIGTHLGDYTCFRSPYFTNYGRISARYYNDWRTWVGEGIADGLVMGDYQPVWEKQGRDYWRYFGEPVDSAERPGDVAAEMYADECKGKCELYYFSGHMHGERVGRIIKTCGKAIREHPADGFVVHEAMVVEQTDTWDVLKEAAG